MFEFIDVKYKGIIDIPTLKIEKEKITTLIGSSGSGKTTILRMLNKMISPTEGKVLYNGIDLRSMDSVHLRRDVSLLSQNPAIFDGRIRDNLNAGLIFQGKGVLPDSDLKEILENVNLKKELDVNASILSGGEKQRLALGRIIVLDPSVYLLDEPSSALDNVTEDLIIKTIIKHARTNNKSIIMVTHSKTIAQKYSDIIIEILEGKSSRRLDYEQNH